jgi:hypothetical protein
MLASLTSKISPLRLNLTTEVDDMATGNATVCLRTEGKA